MNAYISHMVLFVLVREIRYFTGNCNNIYRLFAYLTAGFIYIRTDYYFAVFVDSRMKVFLSLLISCFVLTVSAADGSTSWPALSQGQSCMARSFIGMPESLTPYISSSMREDMIDFFAVGSKKGVTNLLMGESSVEEITDCSITVKLASDKTVLSIRKYFTSKGDSVFVVIETVATPARDSSVRFFDSQWNVLDGGKLFDFPTVEDFAVNLKDKKTKKGLEMVNIALLGLRFTSDGDISAEICIDFLPDEVKTLVAPLISNEPKLYSWNGKRFVGK